MYVCVEGMFDLSVVTVDLKVNVCYVNTVFVIIHRSTKRVTYTPVMTASYKET